MSSNYNNNHPELRHGEVFHSNILGGVGYEQGPDGLEAVLDDNVTPEREFFVTYGDDSRYRMGDTAYMPHGIVIDNARPVFYKP